MTEFEVTITETRCMTVTVKAEDPQHARIIVEDKWNDGEFDMNKTPHKDVDFLAIPRKRSRDYER